MDASKEVVEDYNLSSETDGTVEQQVEVEVTYKNEGRWNKVCLTMSELTEVLYKAELDKIPVVAVKLFSITDEESGLTESLIYNFTLDIGNPWISQKSE